jgi:hypothetical protein
MLQQRPTKPASCVLLLDDTIRLHDAWRRVRCRRMHERRHLRLVSAWQQPQLLRLCASNQFNTYGFCPSGMVCNNGACSGGGGLSTPTPAPGSPPSPTSTPSSSSSLCSPPCPSGYECQSFGSCQQLQCSASAPAGACPSGQSCQSGACVTIVAGACSPAYPTGTCAK